MGKVKIEFSTDSAQFDSPGRAEIKNVLQGIARNIEHAPSKDQIIDVNGNSIGTVEIMD